MKRLRVFFLQLAICSLATAQAPIHYIVSLAHPEQHLVEISVELPPGSESRELQLPVWNALYQVRDFAQYMNWTRAENPQHRRLPVTQLNKSRWRIDGARNGALVEYQMMADNPGPYGTELNSRHAFFNLAELLVYADDLRQSAATVEFRNVPAGWNIATPLRGKGSVYSAENYDQLVDSPVEISQLDESDFASHCGKYRVVLDSGHASDILPKIRPAIERIVATATSWMGDCPFETYTFIYHFPDGPDGGGMEHALGTAIDVPFKSLADNFGSFTSVTAHEFFHLWNVKRIRPRSLEPVDYTQENYTTALWFSEGVNSTVSDFIRLRAGLLDEKSYLDHLGEEITELEDRPAHLTQSAEQSSEDAWLEKYPYYGLKQRSISYYNKGELIGVLLDLRIREATDDRASLRELFRGMNQQYAKQGKFFNDSAGVRQAAESLSHSDLSEFFANYVAGVAEIPWDTFFARVGLLVVHATVTDPDTGFDAVRQFDQPPTVVLVYSGSAAERAGLAPGDVITEIDKDPVGQNYEKSIARLVPGQQLRLTIRRDGVQRQLEWKVGSRARSVYRLEDLPVVTPQHRARRAKWLFDGASQ
jgi:predicted metalloprotease with PDZ domain